MSLVAALGGIGLQVVGPLLVKAAIDFATQGAFAGHEEIVLGLLGLAFLRFGCGYARTYLSARLSLDVQHDLRCAVVGAVSRLDGPGYQRTSAGHLVSRVIADLQLVQALLSAMPFAVGCLVLLVGSLTVMIWLSPLLAAVSLILLPMVGVFAARYRKVLSPTTAAMQQCVADITQHVTDTVTGVRVVKGFAQERRETGTLRGHALRLYDYRLRVALLTSRLTPRVACLPSLSLVVVVGTGSWLVLDGSITLGTFVAFCAYNSALIVPVRVVSRLMVSGQLARAATLRVYELIDVRPGVADPAEPDVLPDGPLAIEFDDVSYRHPGAAATLTGFSLCVAPGETVALVGPPGAGKSTLLALSSRLADPDGGHIRIGGPGHMTPLSRLRLDDLRRAVGAVTEDTVLFTGTIRDNIAFGRPDAGDEQVRAVARACSADAFIERLPDGYDTLVGERGLTLSGGQRQRIALARALLIEPRVLLLDDATSAVDAATEAAMHANLRASAAGRTTILIARRRSTLALADRVVVLADGRVRDVGTVAELSARGSLSDTETDPGTNGESDSEVAAPADRSGSLWPEEPPADDGVVPWRGSDPVPVHIPAGGESSRSLSLRDLLGPVRGLVAVVVGLLAMSALVGVAYPSLARLVVDKGIVPGDVRMALLIAAFGVVLVAGEWLVTAVQVVIAARLGESVLFALRVRAYGHLQRLGLDYYEREPTGRIVTTLTSDVDSLSTFLQTGLAQSVIGLVTVTGVAVALTLTAADLAVVVLAVLTVVVPATVLFRNRAVAAHRAARERAGEMSTNLLELVSGLHVVQVFRRERAATAAFAALSRSYRDLRLRAQHSEAVYFPLLQLLADLSLVVVLGVGGTRVADGTLTPGQLVAFVLYLELFFVPLQALSQVFDGYQQSRIALARVTTLLDTVPSVADRDDGEQRDEHHGGAVARGEVRLSRVRFRYPSTDRDAVADIDLLIRPGETVALVGATGAGKSTLVKLLARFYDVDAGRVLVDGVDVRRIPAAAHRTTLGLVPQEAHLFAGDVAANIAYGRPEAGTAEIEEAARAVGALAMIEELPRGFRQPVGERGAGLSSGQRQLVALARAYLVDPRLLLLDEATAELDPATESRVLTAVDRLSAGRTTVMVSHRLATAARADRIVVLAGGRVAEQGSHTELLRRGGRYAELWRISEGDPRVRDSASHTVGEEEAWT